MSDYAAALTGAGLWVGMGLLAIARWWASVPAPPARHRAPRPLVRAVLDEVTLEQLLPPWPDETAAHDIEPARTWQWCPNDFRYESGALYPDGWICGHCQEIAPADNAAAGLGDAA